MIYPKFIKPNDCIGVPAPSAGAYSIQKINRTNRAKEVFQELGYRTVLSKNILKCSRGRSSSAKERAQELSDMFQNKDIDFIICAAGGEFLMEILPYVNFELLKENPKFVAGFSDPTGLLFPITTLYDIATIYGQNFGKLGRKEISKYAKDFLEIINGNQLEESSYDFYEEEPLESITGLESDNLTKEVYWKTLDDKPAIIKGRIIGGCFDMIATLAGTKYDGANIFCEKYKDDGIIWYFDNCELSMEETIRTLWKLNELGYFKYSNGIVFGRFGQNKSYFNYDVKSCLQDSVIGRLDIPIVYDADISHKPPCLTIINGSLTEIEVKDGKGKIKFILK